MAQSGAGATEIDEAIGRRLARVLVASGGGGRVCVCVYLTGKREHDLTRCAAARTSVPCIRMITSSSTSQGQTLADSDYLYSIHQFVLTERERERWRWDH